MEAGCSPTACCAAVLKERLANSEATGAVAGVASGPADLRDEAAGPSVEEEALASGCLATGLSVGAEGGHTKDEATGAVAGVASATAWILNEEAGGSSKEEA